MGDKIKLNSSFKAYETYALKRIYKSKGFLLFAFIILSANAFSQGITLNKYTYGEGIELSGKNGYTFNLTGFVQPFYELKNYTGDYEGSNVHRYRLRRARLRFDGSSPDTKFSYRISLDLSGVSESGDEASTNYLMDAYIAYQLSSKIKVTFGQRSTYTDNRELYMLSNTLQLPERSRVTSAFASIREFGLFVAGNYRLKNGSYLRPYFVLTNGDGLNVYGKDHGGLKIGGRLDYLPFGTFSNKGQFRQVDIMRENSPKLVVGINYSYNDGMSSRRGRGSGDILYLDENNEESLPDFVKYGVDFLFKYQGFSALGEYVKTNTIVPDNITQRVRNDGSTSTSFLVDGVQDVENYIKGRTMLGEGFNFQMGYLFKTRTSVDVRYTHLKAEKYSFLNNGLYYNRPNYYTLGVSQYLSKYYGAKIQSSVTYVDVAEGSRDVYSNDIFGNEWIFRLILTLSI